jgi:hypothetical protein
MDCRTCQPTLIDLLYGELATDAAEAARAHLRECASCRNAYDKLAAGLRVARRLEIMEPPAHLEHKLLELAHARAVAIAEQRAASAPAALSPWRVAIDFVRRFAMASQVKMVAASALVVTVVLLALPRLWRESQMSPVAATVSPATQFAEEAAPSDGVQPAEPLGLKMDSHSGRIRSAEDEAAAEATARAVPPASEPDQRDEKKSYQTRFSPNRRPSASRNDAEFALQGESLPKIPMGDYREDAPQPRAAAPRPFPSNQDALGRGSAPRKLKITDKEGASPEAGLYESSSSLRVRSGAGVGVATQAPAGDYAASPAAPPQQAKASLAGRLQTARAIAQRDGCAAALSSYEQVVAAGSATLQAGEALLDMAHCRISLGQPAIARALLERASRIPAVAPRARAMLESSAAPNTQANPAAAEPSK